MTDPIEDELCLPPVPLGSETGELDHLVPGPMMETDAEPDANNDENADPQEMQEYNEHIARLSGLVGKCDICEANSQELVLLISSKSDSFTVPSFRFVID